MSLFDPNHVRQLYYAGNGRRKSGRENNNDRYNNGKRNKDRNQKKDNSSVQKTITRRFDDEPTETKINRRESSEIVDSVKDVLNEFIELFNKNLDKPAECRNIIEESIGDICAALKYYYDPKFEDALPEMNKTLDIMSTNHFATNLLGILKQNPFGDEWDTMWKDVAFAISILLDSSANKMKDGTVDIYVSDILSSNGMWKTEITQLTEEFGITEDLAVDLIIGIPVKPEDMTDLNMRNIYQSFLWMLLNHANENIEVLDRNTQRGLFDFFFNDKRGKLACKVVGRFLSDEETKELKELDSCAALVYGEFKTMLLERLEDYDVNNISFVLRFVVDQKKRGKNDIIFDVEEASKYDTIRKAIMQVVAKDPSAKEYLV